MHPHQDQISPKIEQDPKQESSSNEKTGDDVEDADFEVVDDKEKE